MYAVIVAIHSKIFLEWCDFLFEKYFWICLSFWSSFCLGKLTNWLTYDKIKIRRPVMVKSHHAEVVFVQGTTQEHIEQGFRSLFQHYLQHHDKWTDDQLQLNEVEILTKNGTIRLVSMYAKALEYTGTDHHASPSTESQFEAVNSAGITCYTLTCKPNQWIIQSGARAIFVSKDHVRISDWNLANMALHHLQQFSKVVETL